MIGDLDVAEVSLSPTPIVVSTHTNYRRYVPMYEGETMEEGPDPFTGNRHILPRSALCVSAYNPDPNFYATLQPIAGAQDPEGNTILYCNQQVQNWASRFADMTLKTLGIRLVFTNPGDTITYELLSTDTAGNRELVALLSHTIPPYGIENGQYVGHGLVFMDGIPERGIPFQKFGVRRALELVVARKETSPLQLQDYVLEEIETPPDLPRFAIEGTTENGALYQLGGTLDPKVIPDEQVSWVATEAPASRSESLAYLPGVVFRKIYLVLDVLSAVGMKSIAVRVAKSNQVDVGRFTIALKITSNSTVGPQVSNFGYESHRVDVADLTSDGYLVYEFEQWYSDFFNRKITTDHQLHIEIYDYNAGTHAHDPAEDAYIIGEFAGEPMSAGVQIPMWDYDDAGKPLHAISAPSAVTPLLGLVHGCIKEYTPATLDWLAAHPLAPSSTLALANTITTVAPDIRWTTHPHQMGDAISRFLGDVSGFYSSEMGPATGPVVFTARVERMPFTHLYDLQIRSSNAGLAPLTVTYDVHVVPGNVDPATYDFSASPHLVGQFTQSINPETTVTEGECVLLEGDELLGYNLQPAGEWTIMVHLQNPPEDLRHWGVDLPATAIPRSHPSLLLAPTVGYGNNWCPQVHFTFLVGNYGV